MLGQDMIRDLHAADALANLVAVDHLPDPILPVVLVIALKFVLVVVEPALAHLRVLHLQRVPSLPLEVRGLGRRGRVLSGRGGRRRVQQPRGTQ